VRGRSKQHGGRVVRAYAWKAAGNRPREESALETFGQRLRRLRLAASMTTSDLAYRAGVTEGAIRQIESGRTKSASFAVGLKLASILSVDPWVLALGTEEMPDSSRQSSNSVKDRLGRLEARLDYVERELLIRHRERTSARTR
jgi:transcriptional regulator with XRE-family HTH domain